jgi:hypothetical protein
MQFKLTAGRIRPDAMDGNAKIGAILDIPL